MGREIAVRESSADKVLLMTTLVLAGIGVVMVYSASMPLAQEWYGSGYYYLARQLIRLGLGLGVMFLGLMLDYRWWRRGVDVILILCFCLLLLVVVSPLGLTSNGARRWLAWGGFSFQPTEIAKWGLVVYLAHALAKLRDETDSTHTLPIFMVIGAMCLLVAWQPDLGNSLIMAALALILFFIAGVRLRYLGGLGLLCFSGFWLLVSNLTYSQRRILNFLNPWRDPTDAGFQLTQSFLALGRGGLSGVGLGASQQKVFYLPEAHTDFILAVIGEEWGFLGVAGLLVLFAILMWRGLVIARRVPDTFGSYLAAGITSLIGLQVLVNTGVVAGLLPTKGLPLPFISFGGSALVVSMLGMGILLNISRHQSSPATRVARASRRRR